MREEIVFKQCRCERAIAGNYLCCFFLGGGLGVGALDLLEFCVFVLSSRELSPYFFFRSAVTPSPHLVAPRDTASLAVPSLQNLVVGQEAEHVKAELVNNHQFQTPTPTSPKID